MRITINTFKKITVFTFSILSAISIVAQEETETDHTGHTNQNKFKQLYDEFATPNVYRNASGAPGHQYYQQQADYKIKVKLTDPSDGSEPKLTGTETITYTNNSPDKLDFLWLQLDQNKRSKDSKTPLIEGDVMNPYYRPASFTAKFLKERFDGGFNIEKVANGAGKAMKYYINQTMMRIDLDSPLQPGKKIELNIDWWYTVNEHIPGDDRSGYEYFKEDGNRAFVIAQFYPRMCVYNDVEGWQNAQFWGDGEFALNFGDYEVEITVPKDHMMEATGVLQNRKEVYTPTMLKRYEEAKKSFDKPVLLITQAEAEVKEKTKSKEAITWKFEAEKVRDFGFATSRKYIHEMMAVDVLGKTVMAVSMYPKEGNPLWEEYSTKAIKQTLQTYSNMTFQYPYHKAVSVNFRQIGMEYPMICWNWGRPKNGKYTERERTSTIGVIIHEVGHNYFPMIVNSDERQWGWMDEGLNSFLEYLTQQEFEPGFPSRRGPAKNIIPYMSGDQSEISPIMTQADNVIQLGNNAYGKPATALNILRETVMGHEMFDYAFKVYANRWKFKHPTPEDFFRTMEEASGMDLDWFWRGWFYTTDVVDISVKEVKNYYVSNKPNAFIRDVLQKRNMNESELIPLVFAVSEDSEDFKDVDTSKTVTENSQNLQDYLFDNFTAEERAKLQDPKFFYQISFENKGGLVMPLIVKYTYADNTTETVQYPARVWRKNDKEIQKVIPATKKIIKIEVDPDAVTADINPDNNVWPKEEVKSKFDAFKERK